MAKTRTPRSAWVRAALRALVRGGPDTVRIEAIAATLGVSKGGFYWHFADRAALIDEMLDSWEKSWTEDLIAKVERFSDDARQRLRELFALAPSDASFAVELALREWGLRDRTIAKRLKRVDNRRMAYLRDLFFRICDDADEAEARSMIAYSLAIGSHFITAEHGERTRAQVLARAAARLFENPGRSSRVAG